MLDAEKFFRVLSLASLVNIPNFNTITFASATKVSVRCDRDVTVKIRILPFSAVS